ncbi:MAG: hypothetical protein ABIE94_03480 [archaeon]
MKMKKAQVWLPDFLLAFILFALALTLSMKFVVNMFPNQDYARIMDDAERISEVFMSEGVPVDWTNDTVIKPGLLTNGRFDFRKADNLSVMRYTDAKALFNTRYDFFIFTHNHSYPGPNINYSYGYPSVSVSADKTSVDLSGIEYENLVKIDRFVVVDNAINYLVIYVWD